MKPTTQTLKDFLVAQTPTDQYRDTAQYAENVNPDALTDKWIESNTSYIWKVGVLVVADPNKCDWVYLYIGHQRQPSAGFEFTGKLYWRDGENDDVEPVCAVTYHWRTQSTPSLTNNRPLRLGKRERKMSDEEFDRKI